jgi:hypothetical protein
MCNTCARVPELTSFSLFEVGPTADLVGHGLNEVGPSHEFVFGWRYAPFGVDLSGLACSQ